MPPSPDLSPATPLRCQLCAARNSCLIGQMPRAQQERIDPLIRERAFRKGETLQRQTQEPHELIAVKLGNVLLTRAGPDGVSRPISLVGRGHMLGLPALLGGTTQVGAEAASAGRVCVLPADRLHPLLHSDSALLASAHRQMLQAFASLADWSQVTRLRTVSRQLMAALVLIANEQGSRTVLLPSQVALAALLSTTRESVARALRQLNDAGHLHRVDRWHGELTGTHRHIFGDTEADAGSGRRAH